MKIRILLSLALLTTAVVGLHAAQKNTDSQSYVAQLQSQAAQIKAKYVALLAKETDPVAKKKLEKKIRILDLAAKQTDPRIIIDGINYVESGITASGPIVAGSINWGDV